MLSSLVERFGLGRVDVAFIALLAFCLILTLGGINAAMEKRRALILQGGGRQVDISLIRKQISDGDLSSKKALFYRKLPR